jgi:hypothetical protein
VQLFPRRDGSREKFEPSQLLGQERRERRRYLLVASLGGVLVAQSGGRRGVPEPTQKLGQRRGGRRRQDRAGMAEAVEAEVVAARRFSGALVRRVERRRGRVTRPVGGGEEQPVLPELEHARSGALSAPVAGDWRPALPSLALRKVTVQADSTHMPVVDARRVG